jgi:hypothetical protein
MAYDALDTAEVAVGKPVTSTLMTKVKDNFDWLYGQLGILNVGVGIPNGSFEVDTDADEDPDNWTVSDYTGGTHELSTVAVAHGLQALKFVHPGGAGNGGGYAWSDYVVVNAAVPLTVAWSYYTTNGSMKVIVQIRWYDKDQSYLSSTSILNSTANGTAWQRVASDPLWPVANAVYAKVELVGGYTDTDQAGSCYFDDVKITQAWTPMFLTGCCEVPLSTTYYVGISGASGIASNGGNILPRGGYVTYMGVTGYPAGGSPNFSVTLRKNGGDVGTAITSSGTQTGQLVSYSFGDTMALKLVNADGGNAIQLTWTIMYMANLE